MFLTWLRDVNGDTAAVRAFVGSVRYHVTGSSCEHDMEQLNVASPFLETI